MSAELTSVPTDRPAMLRTVGAIGTAAGLLFAGITVWEHAAGLESGGGFARTLNQTGFAVAMAGYVGLGIGLAVARPGGRRSQVFPILVATAWAALLAAAAVEAFTSVDPDADLLNPVGGLLQCIGLIGLGVTTAVAGRWTGWQRFWPLGLAAFYTGALFVPAAFGVQPSGFVAAVWALGYAGLGLALATAASARRSARRGAVAAVLTTGVVLGMGSAAAGASAAEAPTAASPQHWCGVVAREAPIGSEDMYPCSLLERHRYASADSLEHYALAGE
jgi:hypothetical protein